VTRPDHPAAGDNPFSTRHTRPGAIPFRFPPETSSDDLVLRLQAANWCGAIIGPHGSGKSSLLASLVPAIRLAGKSVLLVELHDGQRRLPVDLKGCSELSGPDRTGKGVLVIDGYEQLSWLSRLRVKRFCRLRRIGLVVTSHGPVRLPELFRTSTSLSLAETIVCGLLGGHRQWIPAEELAARLESHDGNLRELLFDLYDLYEQRRSDLHESVS
jgi:hypothetical protein